MHSLIWILSISMIVFTIVWTVPISEKKAADDDTLVVVSPPPPPLSPLGVGFFAVLSAHPKLVAAIEASWGRMIRSMGGTVVYFIEENAMDAYERIIDRRHVHTLPSSIHHCRDRNCHGSYESVVATMRIALEYGDSWRYFVRLDDDLAVCPYSLEKLLTHMIDEPMTFGGRWIYLGKKLFVDEHAVVIGRSLATQFVDATFIDDAKNGSSFVFDSRLVFSVQSVYWAAVWDAHFFNFSYDSGFVDGFIPELPPTLVCAKYAVYHKLKNPDDIRLVEYNQSIASTRRCAGLRQIEWSPRSQLDNSKVLCSLSPVTFTVDLLTNNDGCQED